MEDHISTSSSSHAPLFHNFQLGSIDDKAAEQLKLRKRQRQVLSCEQCHTSKVKCDRQLPCSRCKTSGKAEQCSYTYRSISSLTEGPSQESSQPSPPPQDVDWMPRKEYFSKDLTSNAGRTNWAKVISEFSEARDFVFGQSEEFEHTYRRLTRLKELFSPRSTQVFPLNPIPPELGTRSAILRNLPPSATVRQLVDNYMETFNKTHRMFHRPEFERQVVDFYKSPETVSISWIAQLLSVLSLSCRSISERAVEDLGPTNRDELSGKFLHLAEAALGLSNVMIYPDLTSIATLCTIVVAKSLQPDLPYSTSGRAGLVGFLIRIAMSISLHRDPGLFQVMDASHMETRRRVWNLIVYLDLNMAIDSGMPPILRPGDWDTLAPVNLNENHMEKLMVGRTLNADGTTNMESSLEDEANQYSTDETKFTDAALQIQLSKCFDTISSILSVVNAAKAELDYSRALEWDVQLKAVLWQGQQVFSDALSKPGFDSKFALTVHMQFTLLEVFIRRTLLALHQPFAQHARQIFAYETSRWSFLECSLAMMASQQRLYDYVGDANAIPWFSELVQPDFAVSMLHVILGLRRRDFSDIADQVPQRPAKETTWAALRTSFDIIRSQAPLSFHNLKVCSGLGISIAVLEAMDRGTSRLDAARKAVEDIIQLVEGYRQPVGSSSS